MSASSPQVSLRLITAETVRSVCALAVAPAQQSFVAPNAISLAQALFAPEAWYRAIYLAEEPVGFVMLEDESLLPSPPRKPEVGLWRFMIDTRFQRQGIGKVALAQVIDHVRSKKLFSVLAVSYVPGPGCPEKFYLGLASSQPEESNTAKWFWNFRCHKMRFNPSSGGRPRAGCAWLRRRSRHEWAQTTRRSRMPHLTTVGYRARP